MSAPVAAVIDRDRSEARFRFRYRRAMVEAIKTNVPSFNREYNPSTKVWTVHEPCVDQAIALAQRHFGADAVKIHDRRTPTPTSHAGELDWAQQLHDLLPAEMREKVFRRLLPALHPDANEGHPAAESATKSLTAVFRGDAR